MNKTNWEGRHDKGGIPDSSRKGKRVRTRVTLGYVCVWVAGVSGWECGGGGDTLAQTPSTGLRHPSFNYCRI